MYAHLLTSLPSFFHFLPPVVSMQMQMPSVLTAASASMGRGFNHWLGPRARLVLGGPYKHNMTLVFFWPLTHQLFFGGLLVDFALCIQTAAGLLLCLHVHHPGAGEVVVALAR
jgi:hypothetical protein